MNKNPNKKSKFPPKNNSKRKPLSYLDSMSFMMKWLFRNFFNEKESREGLRSVGLSYCKLIQKIIDTRGTREAIRFSKEVRRVTMCYLVGEIPQDPQVPLTHDNIPLALKDLIPIVRTGTTAEKRWLLTVLSGTRSLKLPVRVDMKPISETGPKTVLGTESSYISFWKQLGKYRSEVVPEFSKYHFTTKSGPNGHGLWTAIYDLFVLNRRYPDLVKDIKNLGGTVLSEKIDSLLLEIDRLVCWFPFWKGQSGPKTAFVRRLSAIPDKEGKTREIAILDYFSQTSLRAIHTDLYNQLRKISQDCTFNQGSFKDKLPKEGPFYSLDLSRATDRFPIEEICRVLKGRYQGEYIDSWKRVMVEIPFVFEGKEYSYGVGNPMGAYSSWASFAIAHHYVVFKACENLKMSWREAPYVLLGDDIVIANKDLALEYTKLIRSLGVEVSDLKTHVSQHSYEFAKRWIHNGEEISPFPVTGWLDVSSRYNLLVNVLHTAETKGWVSLTGVGETIADWYLVTRKRRRFRQQILVRSTVCDAITKVIRGMMKETECLDILCRLASAPSINHMLEDGGKYLFQNACVEAFAESADPSKGKWNLGYMAEVLVCQLTDPSFNDNFEVGFNIIQAIPCLGVHGQIEEMYLSLKREAFEIDTVRGGDWPLLLRAMAIPVTDKIYSIRNYDVMTSASATLGNRMYDRINQIREWYLGLPPINDPTK